MNNKSKFNIIAGLAMIFLFVTSCDTEKEDVLEKGDEIQKVEILEYDELANLVDCEAIDKFRKNALNPTFSPLFIK